MLWPTQTLSKPSSMATLAHSLTCPDHVFPFFCHHKYTEKAIWPRKTTPRWPRCWPILNMCYLVVHHHWFNPWNILWEIHLSFHLRMCIYLLFFWCYHYSMVHMHFSFHTFTSFSVILDIIWQPGSWLTWMVPFHLEDHEAESSSLNSFHVWNIQMVVAIDNVHF